MRLLSYRLNITGTYSIIVFFPPLIFPPLLSSPLLSSLLVLPLPLTHTYTQLLYKNTQAGMYIPVQSIQYEIKSYFKIVSSA